MSEDLLYGTREALVVPALFALLLAAAEVGFKLGRRVRTIAGEASEVQVGTIQGAVLALLGLLLGFTFSMAMSRFDARKQTTLDEANAIGTAYLRARLLPEPQRTETADLLRRYVDARLEAYRRGASRDQLEQVNELAGQLQDRLWSRAVDAAAADPRAIGTGLFIESLNDVIDLSAKRRAAMDNHVPESVLFLLFGVALFAVGFVGYGCGLGNRRNFLPTTTLSLLVALVTFVILDLDRPRRGLIRASQQSMVELRQSLGERSR